MCLLHFPEPSFLTLQCVGNIQVQKYRLLQYLDGYWFFQYLDLWVKILWWHPLSAPLPVLFLFPTGVSDTDPLSCPTYGGIRGSRGTTLTTLGNWEKFDSSILAALMQAHCAFPWEVFFLVESPSLLPSLPTGWWLTASSVASVSPCLSCGILAGLRDSSCYPFVTRSSPLCFPDSV